MDRLGGCGLMREGDMEGPAKRLGCGVDCDGALGIEAGRDNRFIRVSIDRIVVSPKGWDLQHDGAGLAAAEDQLFVSSAPQPPIAPPCSTTGKRVLRCAA